MENRVFSASIHDLEHWTNHGIAFAAAGPNAEVPWAEGTLYAPDEEGSRDSSQ